MKPRRIALIGYGAIAADVAAALETQGHELAALLRPGSASLQKLPEGCARLTEVTALIALAPDLVVETAGHGAVATSVFECLSAGLPVLVSSIGALHDEALLTRLIAAAREGGGRLLLPAGALGGLDYVRAVRHASDLTLTYESRKPPAAWRAELIALGHDPEALTGPVTLFQGTARQAAAAYPQNLNVAAALALAGPGFEATQVAVICDPAAEGNTHVVTARSEFGRMSLSLANRPSPTNPKSSWVVARSLLAAIEQHFSPIVFL